MRVIATGDVHFSAAARNAYRFAFVPWLKKAIKKYKIDELVILGDLTDVKDEHNAWLVNKIVDELAGLSELCPISIPSGNHDYVHGDSPFFEFMRHVPRIRWYHEPTKRRIGDLGDCLFLPHTRNHEKEWPEWLAKKHPYVFTHTTFDDASSGPGKLRGVDPKLFAKQGLVLSGDVHVPQTIGKNIVQVGAPYTINFGDDYEGRVVLLDSNVTPWSSIAVDIPQKRLLDVTKLDTLSVRENELLEGDIVRVRYKLKPGEQERWYEIRQTILEWGEAAGCQIEAIPSKDTMGSTGRTYKHADRRTDHELISEYSKRTGLASQTEKRGLYLIGKSKA